MRCVSCDDPLTSHEMGKKDADGQEYLLCVPCLGKAGLLTQQEREQLRPTTDQPPIEEDFEPLIEELDLDDQ